MACAKARGFVYEDQVKEYTNSGKGQAISAATKCVAPSHPRHNRQVIPQAEGTKDNAATKLEPLPGRECALCHAPSHVIDQWWLAHTGIKEERQREMAKEKEKEGKLAV